MKQCMDSDNLHRRQMLLLSEAGLYHHLSGRRRRSKRTAAPDRPLPPDDDDNQVQYGLLNGTQFPCHHACDHRYLKSGRRSPCPQRRLRTRNHQLSILIDMEEKIKGGSFHPLFSGEAQKKHRPRGSMSTKTVLSVRDQGLEPWTP